jgi:trehalose 6-phosphate synthase
VTVVISNRGPYRFVPSSDGGFDMQPGVGGVASALGPLLTSGAAGADATWIAAALDDGDRAAMAAGATRVSAITLDLIDLDPTAYRLYYDVVSNGVLWFLHHGLFDLPRRPRFDRHFREAWLGYEAINRAFADAATEAASDGDVVLVQDYHLALVPQMLREQRPDLHVAHFTHTPFCGPNSIRVLPYDVSAAICASLAGGAAGFHSARWARAYEASAREVLGAEAPIAPAFVSPISPDPDELKEQCASPSGVQARAEFQDLAGGRKLVVRADRIDPSKNILRGFAAFDVLLESHPEWREQVVFVARLTESRQTLPEYLAYRSEVEFAARRVNERWSAGDWQPVVLETLDDFARTVGALSVADVVLVNPVKDGLNLVAKEAPLVNDRDGVLCLSQEAGAWDELGEAALPVHPFDLEQTAAALDTALRMPDDERARRARRLREIVASRRPRDWLDDQLRAAQAS